MQISRGQERNAKPLQAEQGIDALRGYGAILESFGCEDDDHAKEDHRERTRHPITQIERERVKKQGKSCNCYSGCEDLVECLDPRQEPFRPTVNHAPSSKKTTLFLS